MALQSCAIIGHKATRFKWKYKENNTGCKRLKKRIHDQVILLYEKGVRRFYVGGGLGVDMWAAEIVLRLKEQPGYSDLQLHIVIPFEGHDTDWDERSRSRMAFLIRHSAETITIGTVNQPPKVNYRHRNEYMVDHSDCLLAVYDNNTAMRSGTGMTVNYARAKGKPMMFIHPDSAKISAENSCTA